MLQHKRRWTNSSFKKKRIAGDPFKYKLYLDERPSVERNKGNRPELVTEAQVQQFIDEVFCSFEPLNKIIYSKKNISTGNIYEVIKNYTTVFGEKSTQIFAVWCRNKKLNFLLANLRDLFLLLLSWASIRIQFVFEWITGNPFLRDYYRFIFIRTVTYFYVIQIFYFFEHVFIFSGVYSRLEITLLSEPYPFAPAYRKASFEICAHIV